MTTSSIGAAFTGWPFDDPDTDDPAPQYYAYEAIKAGQTKSCGQVRLLHDASGDPTLGLLSLDDIKAIALATDTTTAYLSLHVNTKDCVFLWLQGRCLAELTPAAGTQLGLGEDELQPGCPTCAHPGNFHRMALVCPLHGPFAGC